MKRNSVLGSCAAVASALVMACQGEIVTPQDGNAPSFSILYDGNGFPRFVGKGDVQTFFVWNNQVLQANAAYIDFRLFSQATTTWHCLKEVTNPQTGEIIQEIDIVHNSTETTQGFFTTLGRDISEGKNGPNTGFILTLDGTPTVVTDGPPTNSCPDPNSGFVEGSSSTVSNGSGLQITKTGPNAGPWYNFP